MLPGMTPALFGGPSGLGNDANTVLLLHGNYNYVDSCAGATPHLFTPNGTQTKFSPTSKFGGGSMFFGFATTDRISCPQSSDFDFGTGDFCIDLWVYRQAVATCSIIAKRPTSAQYSPFMFHDGGSGALGFYASSTGSSWDLANNLSMGTIPINTWTHLAVTRSGTTFRLFVNGAQVNTFTSAASLYATSSVLSIGGASDQFSASYLINEVRISKGVARWVANFTPPATQYGPEPVKTGNDRWTYSLLHFDGANGSTTITDSNAYGSTRTWAVFNGSTISTAQSRFGGSSSLTNGSNNGFSTQTLVMNLWACDFTIDFWFYCTGGAGARRTIYGIQSAAGDNGNIQLEIDATNKLKAFLFSSGAASVVAQGAATPSLNAWHHAALVRNADQAQWYLDGAADGAAVAVSGMLWPTGGTPIIGRPGDFNGFYYPGHIDEFRVSFTPRWTANFTPPAAAYT